MQRLFSMFPNGWPGAALLLLRLVAGILLIHNGMVALVSGVAVQIVFVQSVAIGGGILLILGLWTPIAGALVSLVEICLMFPETAQMQSNILLGTLGAALVALGPGVRSLDALL
jgi:putative oxidoreductase